MTKEEAKEIIEIIDKRYCTLDREERQALTVAIKALEQEPLTDKEQRIFLSAMGREEKVCREVDAEHPRENYEDTLLFSCRNIIKKVKGVLWGI